MLELESDRLLLRDWQDSDWRDAHIYATDPEVSRYMIWGPNTEQETREFVRSAVDKSRERPRRAYEMAVVHKRDNKVIGGCGIRIVGPDERTAVLGYVLHRKYWRRGLMSEAVLCILEYGFHELCLHRVYATCDKDNIASERIMQKAGMRREGHFVKDMLIKGQWRDSYLYAILASEFFERYGSERPGER